MRRSLRQIIAGCLLVVLPLQVWGMSHVGPCDAPGGNAPAAAQFDRGAQHHHAGASDTHDAGDHQHHGPKSLGDKACGMCAMCAMCFQAVTLRDPFVSLGPKPSSAVADLVEFHLLQPSLAIPEPVPIAPATLA